MTDRENAGARGPVKGVRYNKLFDKVCPEPECPREGVPFQATAKRVYCSPACNLRAWRRRQKEEAADAVGAARVPD